jgi:hypothetical protein
MEEVVFKRPIPLFWPERVRKLVTPVLGNRSLAVSEAVLAHGPERPRKRVGLRIPDGQRAVLGPVLGFSFAHSQGRFRIMCQTLSKTGRGPFWDPSWKLGCARFQGRFRV